MDHSNDELRSVGLLPRSTSLYKQKRLKNAVTRVAVVVGPLRDHRVAARHLAPRDPPQEQTSFF